MINTFLPPKNPYDTHHEGAFTRLLRTTFSCLRQDLCPSKIGHSLLPPQGSGVWNTLPDNITSAPSLSVFRHKLIRL